jgi:serine protease Do
MDSVVRENTAMARKFHIARAFIGWLLIAGLVRSEPVLASDVDWRQQVLKLVVTRANGMVELGSAVPIAGERMATNCHVLRDAARIEVEMEGGMRHARADLRDAYRDLCFISVPGFRGVAMPMIDIGQTRVGLDVLAVGYPGGKFAVSPGKIIGLHTCECDGGKVIQTSAPFDRGASGGGLFDRDGRLVGILTFKAKTGGNFHFALPVGWLRHIAEMQLDGITTGHTFWESPGKESGYFLTACDLGAKQNWRSLVRLAAEWSDQEPNNPEAWMALGRANRGLGQSDSAVSSFQRVLMLDSTHAEAKWALQQLEFELGRSLQESGGI